MKIRIDPVKVQKTFPVTIHLYRMFIMFAIIVCIAGEFFAVGILLVLAGLVILLPCITFLLAGSPLSWSIPVLQGFNFRGGLTVLPELAALLARAARLQAAE